MGEEAAAAVESSPFRFFATNSFWNVSPAPQAAVDPSSRALVDRLVGLVAGEEKARTGPWINATYDSVPIYTVPAGAPVVSVKLEGNNDPALAAAWTAVPLPAGALPARGADKHLVVWQPSTDRLWEFWRLAYGLEGWHAAWGGAIERASSFSGAYGPEAWPGAHPWWGASATSLSIAGGLVTLEDLRRGHIEHALALAVPNVRAGEFAAPAERDDGTSTESASLPEGAQLRLDPHLNLAALGLPPLTRMLAEAAQRYGMFVRDRAKNVSFYAQDPTPTGTNPYAGPTGYFEGRYPNQLLASFPWTHLEVLAMSLRSRSG